VRAALGLREAVDVLPVAGDHRNQLYEITRPIHAFLKLPRLRRDNSLVDREAIALRAAKGLLPVPRCLACSAPGARGRAFLITATVEAVSLEERLSRARGLELRPLFLDLRRTLEQLAADRGRLRRRVVALEPGLSGVGSAGFSPARWLGERRHPHGAMTARLPRPRVVLVHGSFSPNNILVSSGRRPRLRALLDLEAIRRGPAGFDHALLWYHLWRDGHPRVAGAWARTVLSGPRGRRLAPGFVACAAWLSAFRSLRRGPGAQRDRALRPAIESALRRLVGESVFRDAL
jgi:hypothetical protein